MTIEKAYAIVDDFYRHNKGNIRLVDFELAIKDERAAQAAKNRAAATSQLLENRSGEWAVISDETRAMIQTLKGK